MNMARGEKTGHDYSAAARKGWATRKAMARARAMEAASCGPGYGPDGPKRGRQRHKVKSFGEILERLRAGAAS